MDGSGDAAVSRRVRRWNRARSGFAFLTLAGLVFCVVSATGNLIPAWAWIAGFVATFVSGCLLRIAWDKHREALFAGARTVVGTVVDIHERPGSGDMGPTYLLLLDAELPGGVMIHRRINIGSEYDPLRWVGTRVHFRHRTLDPDDLDDAFFGRRERTATLGPGA